MELLSLKCGEPEVRVVVHVQVHIQQVVAGVVRILVQH
jgi:hypothetical protein